MVVVPAIGLGLLFVFLVGAGMIYVFLGLIPNKGKDNPRLYRDALRKVDSDYLTEGEKEQIAIGGGIAAVGLVIILIINVPREWTPLIWYGLTAIGVLFGISTFFLFGSTSNSKAETKHKPTDAQTKHESKKEQPEYQAEHHDRMHESQVNQQELERARQKHRADYQDRLNEIQRKQTEIKAIKDDLYSLFGISDDQSQKRGKLLEGVLNRFFKANDIIVREALEFVEQEGEEISEHIDGVIEIDGCLYLIEMKWRKEPLSTADVSLYLFRLFNRGFPGGILISNSEFSQPAITTCKEAISLKIVILCELEEIVTLLEKNGSLKDFLKAKITAAVVDKNPLIKP
jgi:hypothetical protein